MKALVDGDLISYKFGGITTGGRQAVRYLIDKFLYEDILNVVEANSYSIYLTGDNNFRRELNPSYKAQRPEERPEFWSYCREYMQERHNAILTNGCEADDYLGIYQRDNTVICSLDKDLLMIPGRHYSWPITHGDKLVREEKFQVVEPLEGLRHFYSQMLIGDSSDNIKGVNRIGPKKANKLLGELTTEEEMKKCVKELYNDEERFYNTADLLWIWRDFGITYSVREEIAESII